MNATKLGAIGVVVLVLVVLGLRGCGQPTFDPVVEGQRAVDSARVANAKAAQVRLQATVDSLAAALEDSAAVHRKRQQRLVGSANRLRDSIAVLENLATTVGLDSAGQPTALTDSAALTASCAVRYRLRSAEADSLRAALTACDQKASADSTRAQLVVDSAKVATGRLLAALEASDSARRVEIVRPRPCRRDFVLWHPSCSTADAVTLGLGFVLGVAVTR